MTETKRIHYYGIDFLRAFSCISIMIVHVKANTNFNISGFIYNEMISSFSELVYLFMMISGLGMCMGYYNKFKENKIDINQFYLKRYQKVLPFFCFLLIIAIILEHDSMTVIEAFTEVTLTYGLLPNNSLGTIGASWFLGVIFLFYFIFPFIVFLTWNRRRAILTFLISIVINYCCVYYFFTEKFVIESFAFRHNFLYCVPFVLGGVIVYLYKDSIEKIVKKEKIWMLIIVLVLIFAYYIIPNKINDFSVFTVKNLVLFCAILSFSLGSTGIISNNKIVYYLSSISLELYLCHMLVFRGIEKLHLLSLFGDGWASFVFSSIATVLLSIMFVELFKIGKKMGSKTFRKLEGEDQ